MAERAGPAGLLEVLESLAHETVTGEPVARAASPGATGRERYADESEYAGELYARIHANFARLRRGEAMLLSLFDYIRELSKAGGIGELLATAARQARHLLLLDTVFISVPDDEPGRYRIVAADGQVTTATVGTRLPGGSTGFGGDRGLGRTPVWTPDYLADNGFEHTSDTDRMIAEEGLRGLIAAPLYADGRRFAVLYGGSRGMRRFTAAEVSLIERYAELVAAFVRSAAELARNADAIAAAERSLDRADADLADLRNIIELCHSTLDEPPNGETVSAHVELWAKALGFDIAVYGRDDRLVTASGVARPAVPADQTVLPAAEAAVARAAADLVQLGDGRSVVSVDFGGEHLGTLVARPERALTERDTMVLRLAVRVIAACLSKGPGQTSAAGGRQRDGLLAQLLRSDAPTPSRAVLARLRELGADLEAPHLVVIARTEPGLRAKAEQWAEAYARRLNGLYLARAEDVTLLVPGSDPSAASNAVREELASALRAPVTVGAGGPAHMLGQQVRAAYAEARRCLSAMLTLGMVGRSAAPDELGFLGLLLAGGRDVPQLVGSVVGPVFEYDDQRSGALVETLDAYFESGSNATAAAKALHVHPNTVSRRLERISELLGPDWQHPQRVLEIQVALQLARMRGGLSEDAGTAPSA
ncbi:helix-turn-helix domain-containing protein [Actinospica sp. MGRD01-02]|uniref:Helix-turn-helix domain-containing protein n=1 Tax=Actinospica acidithermotolerans TaxID=2828514 RepID=A0A941ECM9_9ACTN|nr:helix-turn-helix domain-containing protein [Actinospica acidithermotolerans]MBR7828842.1 helix-turn-helix domain-containing protein [Actinospica acidithermotolerans]